MGWSSWTKIDRRPHEWPLAMGWTWVEIEFIRPWRQSAPFGLSGEERRGPGATEEMRPAGNGNPALVLSGLSKYFKRRAVELYHATRDCSDL